LGIQSARAGHGSSNLLAELQLENSQMGLKYPRRENVCLRVAKSIIYSKCKKNFEQAWLSFCPAYWSGKQLTGFWNTIKLI